MGLIQPAAEATVPVTDEGLLRGDGVFEVARVYGGVPYALDEHLVRMARSAERLRLPFDAGAMAADAAALLEAGGPVDGYLRLVATRGGLRILLLEPLKDEPGDDLPAHRALLADPRPGRDQVALLRGEHARRRAWRGSRGRTRRCSSRPTVACWRARASRSSCRSTARALVTPPLSDRVLDSITRRRMMETGLVTERSISADELPFAREAFLASTTNEALPVHAIDGVALPEAPGPLTQRAAAAVREVIGAAVGQTLSG